MKSDNPILSFKDTVSIAVKENGEEIVPLGNRRIKAEYRKDDMVRLLGETIYVRQSVASKLYRVQERLDAEGRSLILFIVYGYRTPEVQSNYYEARLSEVRLKFPNLSADEQIERAHAMSAHPDSAGHPTGGAIDITLWNEKEGHEVDMGSGIAEFGGPERTNYPNLTMKQKENRTFLQKIMVKEGFAPFLGEWWHFSYGDKEWTAFYSKPNALYSTIPLQKVERH